MPILKERKSGKLNRTVEIRADTAAHEGELLTGTGQAAVPPSVLRPSTTIINPEKTQRLAHMPSDGRIFSTEFSSSQRTTSLWQVDIKATSILLSYLYVDS